MSAGAAAPPPPDAPSGRALLLDRLRERLGPTQVEEGGAHIRCRPGSAAELGDALQAASVGGVRASCTGAPAALLHLELSRLTTVALDEVSLLCTAGAGLTLGALEAALRERGLSLGPVPAPSRRRSLGAALGAPRPAEASPLLGRLRDRAVRIEAVLPRSDGWRPLLLPALPAPRRAAGPDLKQLVIGGGGQSGVITAATLPVVRPGPATRYLGFSLPIGRAAAALCALLRRTGGAGPADAMILGGALAAVDGAAASGEGAALLVRAEGPGALVEAQAALLAALCGDAEALPGAFCQAWLDGEEAQAARIPAGQRALPALSPVELGQLLGACGGPRLLCGVHLHGAALCAEPGALAALPAPPPGQDSGAARLRELLRAQLDPHALLC